LPMKDGKIAVTGLLGRDLDTAAGQEAARLCAINVLAQAKAALGDLEKIRRLVKISVYVASSPTFTDQHPVGNGASDFFAQVLGERGKHARVAVGMAALPLNAAVEIASVIEVEEAHERSFVADCPTYRASRLPRSQSGALGKHAFRI